MPNPHGDMVTVEYPAPFNAFANAACLADAAPTSSTTLCCGYGADGDAAVGTEDDAEEEEEDGTDVPRAAASPPDVTLVLEIVRLQCPSPGIVSNAVVNAIVGAVVLLSARPPMMLVAVATVGAACAAGLSGRLALVAPDGARYPTTAPASARSLAKNAAPPSLALRCACRPATFAAVICFVKS